MEKTRPGVYRHYKGKEYSVYGEAILSGSEVLNDPTYVVVYRPRYGARQLTYRPKTEFFETIQAPDGPKPRFVFVREFDEPELKAVAECFSS